MNLYTGSVYICVYEYVYTEAGKSSFTAVSDILLS